MRERPRGHGRIGDSRGVVCTRNDNGVSASCVASMTGGKHRAQANPTQRKTGKTEENKKRRVEELK